MVQKKTKKAIARKITPTKNSSTQRKDNTTFSNVKSTSSTITEPPAPIKVICIYNWFIQGFFAMLGLMLLLFANAILGFLTTAIVDTKDSEAEKAIMMIIGALSSGFGILIGIIIIAIALFFAWITYELWKGKNWARITQTVFSAMGLFNFPGLLINGLIIYFLWFDDKTKDYFENK